MDANDILFKLSAGTKLSFAKLRKDKSEPVKNIPIISVDNNRTIKKELLDVKESVHSEPDQALEPDCRKRKYETGNIKLLKGMVEDNENNIKTKKKKVQSESNLKKISKQKQAELRNKHHISVLGKQIPDVLVQFEDLKEKYGVSSSIIKNISMAGYTEPTPIQMQAIPLMLEGRQVLACAPTGSGKTAAFLLPIIHALKQPSKVGFRAVIVCPTRELASQTFRECNRLSAGTGLRAIIISKISHAREKFGSHSVKKYDILVTTPNRMVYLLKQEPPVLKLKKVEWLVVDESDKLFEAGVRGFRDQLAVIYNACDSLLIKRALFSATQTPHLAKWCRKNLKDVASVNVGVRNSAADTVQQELLFVGNESGKLIAFRDLIRKGLYPPVLVFVQSKERAQELFNELIYDGINVDVIHSDRSQTQRDNVIRCFREGKIWVLICTELMGRGIDFKGVNLVVNYDFPPSAVSYVHRIGRTGRAGRPGKAVTYFTQEDTVNLRSIAALMKASGCDVPDYMLTMKKPNKRDKKRLEQQAPRRDDISTMPVYQKTLDRRKKNAIERTKKNKIEKKSKLLAN